MKERVRECEGEEGGGEGRGEGMGGRKGEGRHSEPIPWQTCSNDYHLLLINYTANGMLQPYYLIGC